MQDSVYHMPLKSYLINDFREHFAIRKRDVSVEVNAQHKKCIKVICIFNPTVDYHI